jgi:hypothetical protein
VKKQSVDARSPRGLGKPPIEQPKKTQEELMMEEMMNDDLLNVFKTEEVSGIQVNETTALDYNPFEVPADDSIQYYTDRGSRIMNDSRPLFNDRSVNKKQKKLQNQENEKRLNSSEVK